jgi:protein-tyrosine phosphatase
MPTDDRIDCPFTRMIALGGSRNFRDLGGCTTLDGRRVRRGRLFRSGTLAYLTPAGQRGLAELGIRTICDLRTTRERLSEPSVALPTTIRTVSWDYELDHGAVMGAVRVTSPKPEEVRGAITEFYRTAPEDFAERFAQIFDLLRTDQAPLVLHCTAGKDRTGVAAALLLTALGVSRTDVLADYVRSDQVTDFELLRNGDSWRFLRDLPPQVRAPLFAAEPAYIEAMLERVHECHGSVEQYLRVRLNFHDHALAQLRQLYLTD